MILSLDEMEDDAKAAQTSGHYSMTISRNDAKTDRFLAVSEIHVTQGESIA